MYSIGEKLFTFLRSLRASKARHRKKFEKVRFQLFTFLRFDRYNLYKTFVAVLKKVN